MLLTVTTGLVAGGLARAVIGGPPSWIPATLAWFFVATAGFGFAALVVVACRTGAFEWVDPAVEWLVMIGRGLCLTTLWTIIALPVVVVAATVIGARAIRASRRPQDVLRRP
ncbi:MAG: hypothetical protein ABI746_10105 [Dermatophilaceae bacterium]